MAAMLRKDHASRRPMTKMQKDNEAQCSPRLLKVLAGKAPQEAQEILYLATVFALRLLGLLWSGLFKPKQFCISADQLVGQQVARLLRNQALCVLCKPVFPIQQSFARILEWTSFSKTLSRELASLDKIMQR